MKPLPSDPMARRDTPQPQPRAPNESDRSRLYSALILDLAGQLLGGKA